MKRFRLALILITGAGFIVWKLSRPLPSVNDDSEVLTNTKSTIVAEVRSQMDIHPKKIQTTLESSDFPDRLDLYFKTLATTDDFKNLTVEEVHHTPEIIKNGGEVIGRVHDEADNDPSKRIDAMNFFKRCAEDQQIATVLRAVCLNKIYKLIPVWQIPVPLSDANIPDEVSDLALKLP